MPILLFIVAALIMALGIMFVIGKGLNYIFDTGNVTEKEVSEYRQKWNAVAIRIAIGVGLILASVYMIITGIAITINLYEMFYITTYVMLGIALFGIIFVSTSKIFRGEEYGRNKSTKNKAE